jgi:PAS domain S-box-containing protein
MTTIPIPGHGETEASTLLDEDEREVSVVISDPSLPDNPLIFVSEEFERQTGYPAAEALGRNCRFLQGPGTDPRAVAAIHAALDAGTEITVDILNYRRDGRPFWNRLRIRPLLDASGRVRYFAGAQNPIDEGDVLPRPVHALFG